ncbi:MAG: hypothetical protein R3A12_15935 [Ignavibacteria bacterium]
MKLECNRISKNIVIQSIQRTASTTRNYCKCASDKSDEIQKVWIIEKEGRNIRAFEAVTGVDIIVDDTPEAIIISDSIRSEGKLRE